MKIGEVEIKRIPPGQDAQCQYGCPGPAVAYYNGTPYCADCLREEQEKKWEADGNFFLNGEGERVYFEVVRKAS